ncbi:MAG: class I SAM-dependent methyltransferase [Thermoanaerobaculia bacterium]|nr:class I SAM-dependent methyltransferase [Thermoanaerobaculia bacterium]
MTEPPTEPRLEDFLDPPTRRLEDWAWLWSRDQEFPLRSHRGLLGRFLVACKRMLRPLVKVPQNDLWERQRTFNLILLEHLQSALPAELSALNQRVAHLETFMKEGLDEVMQHNDALFTRVDQKLDHHRRATGELSGRLGAALARLPEPGVKESEATETLRRAFDESAYLDFEERFRGDETDIAARVSAYLPRLAGHEPILDLGCGRGEALSVFCNSGLAARGVDSSAEMVAHCVARGLDAVESDLLDYLVAVKQESLGAIVSFHVIEHLPPALIDRLVRLAWGALRPGGQLILETPNPLSMVVAARSFWLDPTHVRPVHPEYLASVARSAGFESVERLDLRPFPTRDRLPEVSNADVGEELHSTVEQIHRLRDRLDDLLFGFQDYAIVARKG